VGNLLTVQAQLQGDASSLVAALKDATNALQKFEGQAGKAQAAVGSEGGGGGIGNAVGAGGRSIAGAVVGLTMHLAKLAAGAALAGTAVVTAFAGSGMKAGLQRMTDIQDATVSLTRMLGSAAAAADLTGKALDVVRGTPFAFPDFAQATRQLVAYGVSAQKVPGVLQAIADSAAASGQGMDAVAGLTGAFAKLQVQGKLSADILDSFGVAGVNGLALVANHYKTTTDKAQEMIAKGLVPANVAMDILTKGIEQGSKGAAGNFNGLAGAAKALGATISGSIGNTKAAFARMGAAWLAPFKDDIPNVLNNGVIPLLDKMGTEGVRIFQKLKDTGFLDKITKGFQDLTGKVGPAVDEIIHIWDKVGEQVTRVFDRIKASGTLDPIIAMFKGLPDHIDPAIKAIGDFAIALSPVHLVIDALVAAAPSMGDSLATVARTIQDQVIPAMAQILEAIVPILPAIGELIAAFVTGLVPVLPTVRGLIETLVGIIQTLVPLVTGLPTPLLATAAALVALQMAGVPVGGILKKVFDALLSLVTVGPGAAGAARGAATAVEGLGAAAGEAGAAGKLKSLSTFLAGPWGIAIAAAATGVILLDGYLKGLQSTSSEMQNSLKTTPDRSDTIDTASKGRGAGWGILTGKFDDSSVSDRLKGNLHDVLDNAAKQADGLAGIFARFSGADFGPINTLKAMGTELGKLAATDLPDAQRAFANLAQGTDGSDKDLWRLISTTGDYKQALTDIATNAGLTADKHTLLAIATGNMSDAQKTALLSSGALKEGMDATAGSASLLFTNMDSVRAAISKFGADALTADQIENSFQSSVQNATATIASNGATLDIHTKAGLANRTALDAIAQATLVAVDATYKQSGSMEQATRRCRRSPGVPGGGGGGRYRRRRGEDDGRQAGPDPGERPHAVTARASTGMQRQRLREEAQQHPGRSSRPSSTRSSTQTGAPHGQVGAAYDARREEGRRRHRHGRTRTEASQGADDRPRRREHPWAEPETGWEAYISGKPSQEARNAQVWRRRASASVCSGRAAAAST
jgi:hypothetical protein